MRFTRDHEYIDVSGDIGDRRDQRACAGRARRHRVRRSAAGRREGSRRAIPAAVVESVKAASDVFAPASGEVVAVNDKLGGSPSLVNEEAQGGGWLFKLKLSERGELDGLMDADAYGEYLKTLD